MVFHDGSLDSHHHHEFSAFPKCCRAGAKTAVTASSDGPIIPSNCKTHLTCKPVHPPRKDIWNSWSDYLGDWFVTSALWVTGGAVALGACVYGYSAIDKARKKRRDARLRAEGRRPPSEEGSGGEDSDQDERGDRG
jgi:hypothetical protein